MKTGGGDPPADVPEDTQKVLDIIGKEVDDLGCSFDDDVLSSKGNSS